MRGPSNAFAASALVFTFFLAGIGQTKADRVTDLVMQEWTAERDRSRQAFCSGEWPGNAMAQGECFKKQERADKVVEVYTKTVMALVESKVAGVKPLGVALFKMWGLCAKMTTTKIESFLGPYIDSERMQSCFAVQYEAYQDLVKALRL